MLKRFDQKTTGATSWIKNRFAKFRLGDRNHESDDWTRRIKLSGIARGIAHLAQHGLVERTERVQFLARTKMDSRNFINHIAQQIAAEHAVISAFKNRCDYVATITTVASAQASQITEQAFFFSSRRRHTRSLRDWSSDVCSSDLHLERGGLAGGHRGLRDAGRDGLAAAGRGGPRRGAARGTRQARSRGMNHRLTLTSAAAVILASVSLYPLIAGAGWFWAGAGAVVVVAAAGTATRMSALPAAAIATILAILAVAPLLVSPAWYWEVLGMAIVICAAGSVTRLRLLPAVASATTYLAGLLLYLNVVFAGPESVGWIVPTKASQTPR